MNAIFKRELRSYFHSITGWLFGAFLLIFTGIYTRVYNLSGYYSNFEYAISAMCFIYLIAVPILTMRSVAEEKRSKTDQLLYALPIRMTDVIMGKYCALLVVLALPCGVMALYPLILSQFGTVAYTTAYGALIGFFLLGATLLSLGLFVSSVTESQVAAAVITLVACLILYFMSGLADFVSDSASASFIALVIAVLVFAVVFYIFSKNSLMSVIVALVGVAGLYLWYMLDSAAFSGLFADIMGYLSVFERFDTFVDGVFDLTAVVYFISITAVNLFMCVQVLEKRRWSE